MSVFDNKDGFRPRDQSVSTKIKYEMEAQHWVDAFKNAKPTNQPPNFSQALSNLALMVGLLVNLVLIVVLALTSLFKWIFKATSKTQLETDSSSIPEVDYTVEDFINNSRKRKSYR